MAIYVLGDVQGCFDDLLLLLETIKYDQDQDTLWFTGDLVNRGPNSLEVLRFVKNLPRCICVLGNHDLSLLALAYTSQKLDSHTLEDILKAPDKDELLTWLRYLPLLHQDLNRNSCLVHAGIYPAWGIEEASQFAEEVENELRGPNFRDLLSNMFGNTPSLWHNNLAGWERYRFIINTFTRMRFCHLEGSLELSYKGTIADAPPDLVPWFEVKPRALSQMKILFGHWAALGGQVTVPNIYALDTGCVWGGALTALRLEDGGLFSVRCSGTN
jgi:bis(5'-nucleosyl)-tetraphosphatase (symmetrical)